MLNRLLGRTSTSSPDAAPATGALAPDAAGVGSGAPASASLHSDLPQFTIGEELEADAELLIAEIVEHAVAAGASDLFFSTNENDVEVTMRHLGIIRPVTRLALSNGIRCLACVRGASGMKYAEKRHPQDGRWIFRRTNGPPVDLRLSTLPTLYGESLAMRILHRNSHLTKLEALGFVGSQFGAVKSLLHSPGGLILVTGPTGSGKTTTLYAALHALNDGRRKIHTIEDPIEYAVPGLRQTQVDDANGVGFAEMLRAVLRQGPDIVMIGEVRDTATAETAVRAANSGQLVFATLHAPVAAAAIQSMLGMGISPHLLCSSLLGVIGQRLIRVLNPGTRLAIDLSDAPQTFDEVRAWLEPQEAQTVFMAPPAVENGGSDGYDGRSGVFEVLLSSPALRRSIADLKPTSMLAQQAIEEGMIDFRRAALIKVAKGLTSFDEMQRAVPTGSMWVDE
jgi:type II secretory ATPase GspE/PulE/Tfp pilus assembly ATPase PilB-like protein